MKHKQVNWSYKKSATILLLGVFLVIGFIVFITADWGGSSLSNNIKAYYRLNEGAGTLAEDVVNRDGSVGHEDGLYNITLAAASANWVVTGKSGGALEFTHLEGEHMNLSAAMWNVSSNMTLSFWVRLDANNTISANLWRHFRTGTSSECLWRFADAIGNWEIACYNHMVQTSINFASGNISTWHHYVLQMTNNTVAGNGAGERGNVTIWRDGEVVGHDNSFNYSSIGGAVNMFFGDQGTSPDVSIDGRIDEIGWWDDFLTAQQVVDLYNSGTGLFYPITGSGDLITVKLISPPNDTSFGTDFIEFYTNMTMSTNINLDNATLYLWNSSLDIYNKTTNTTIEDLHNQSYIWVDNIALGSYHWNTYACGTNTTGIMCFWAPSNFTLEVGAQINEQLYPLDIYETENSRFVVNVTLISGANLFAAKLVYNGTSYLATKTNIGGNNYTLERYIDIPLLNGGTQNRTFYWTFEYLNGMVATQSSNAISHNVSQLNISKLTNTYPFSTPIVNFTFYNETNRSEINADLDGAFIYWLGKGSVKKNYTYTSTSEVDSFALALNTNMSVNVSAIINLQSTGSGVFSERNFYFNKERYINQTMTNTSLFLVDAGITRAIIVQARSSSLIPLNNYFIKIYRFYPENNSYEIIERGKTDEYGQIVARLVEPDTVKYRFQFLDENNTIEKTTNDMTIACRATICVLPFVIEDTTQDFERFENISDYDWTFYFDNSTNKFIFTWNDISGVSAVNWLKVQRTLLNGTTIVCNETSSDASGILTCSVGDSESSYSAQVFRSVDGGTWRRIGSLEQEVGTTYLLYGKEGLLWSFILLMTMIAIGYWYPPVGIVLYLGGTILLWFLKIIYLNPAILIAEFVIGVAFIWAFSGRKTS